MDWMVLLFGKRIKEFFVKPAAAKQKTKPDVNTAPKEEKAVLENKGIKKAESKKGRFFFLDSEYLALVLVLLLVLFGGKAFGLTISAPDSVLVNDKAVFDAELVNNSDSPANIVVNFFSPAKSEVTYPKQLAPNSTGKAVITVYNDVNNAGDYTAAIEVINSKEVVKKEVVLSFSESKKSNSSAFMAFFSIPLFNEEISSFGAFEWVFFWVLVIAAAFLIVSFISRLVRRN